MKDSTLKFAKDYKVLLYSINFVLIFLWTLHMFKIVDYAFLTTMFPWISAPLAMIDLWISLCFFASIIIDGFDFSYKKVIGDFLLISTIFYNSIHVFLSLYFSTRYSVPWFFYYGCYHFIFALALYFIFKNYKNHEKKHSPKALTHTGIIILSGAAIFIMMVLFVLHEQERIIIRNDYLIYSLAIITIFNLTLSLYFVIKFRRSTRSNFIAHKYVNLSSAIFSIFIVQAVYLNVFCENIELDKMRTITMYFAVPCFFALTFIGIYLIRKAKHYNHH